MREVLVRGLSVSGPRVWTSAGLSRRHAFEDGIRVHLMGGVLRSE